MRYIYPYARISTTDNVLCERKGRQMPFAPAAIISSSPLGEMSTGYVSQMNAGPS